MERSVGRGKDWLRRRRAAGEDRSRAPAAAAGPVRGPRRLRGGTRDAEQFEALCKVTAAERDLEAFETKLRLLREVQAYVRSKRAEG